MQAKNSKHIPPCCFVRHLILLVHSLWFLVRPKGVWFPPVSQLFTVFLLVILVSVAGGAVPVIPGADPRVQSMRY